MNDVEEPWVLSDSLFSEIAAIAENATQEGPRVLELPTAQQQVTRHNFDAILPEVKDALESCAFFAWDCEFSGLTVEAPAMTELYDDAADRYKRALRSARQFTVLQFGLSVFSRDAATGGYTAKTFNFWVFPQQRGSHDARFLCQASSLEFLACKGFDFNKVIYDGIPFVPLRGAVGAGGQVEYSSGSTYNGTPAPVSQEQPVPAVSASNFSQVIQLMGSCGRPAVLHNALTDLAYTFQCFVGPLPNSWADFKAVVAEWFPSGVYDTKVLAAQLAADAGLPQLLSECASLGALFERLSPGGAADLAVGEAAAAQQAQSGVAGEAAGIAAPGPATGASADQQQPCSSWSMPSVEHAPGYRLYRGAGSSSSTAGSSSSSSASSSGSSSVSAHHYTARPASQTLSPHSSSTPEHEAGYDAFMTGACFARLAAAAAAVGARVGVAAAAAISVPAATAAVTSASASPTVASAPGPAAPASEVPTTSVVAAAVASAAAADAPVATTTDDATADVVTSTSASSDAAVSTSEAAQEPQPSAADIPFSWVRGVAGRLYSQRADLTYLNLGGTDPAPVRPDIYVLTSLSPYTKPGHVTAKFAAAGLGRVRLAMGPSSGVGGGFEHESAPGEQTAFVQMLSARTPDHEPLRVAAAVRKMHGGWRVRSYEQYHADKNYAVPARQQQAGGVAAFGMHAVAEGAGQLPGSSSSGALMQQQHRGGLKAHSQPPKRRGSQQALGMGLGSDGASVSSDAAAAGVRAPPKRTPSTLQLRQVGGAGGGGGARVITAVIVRSGGSSGLSSCGVNSSSGGLGSSNSSSSVVTAVQGSLSGGVGSACAPSISSHGIVSSAGGSGGSSGSTSPARASSANGERVPFTPPPPPPPVQAAPAATVIADSATTPGTATYERFQPPPPPPRAAAPTTVTAATSPTIPRAGVSHNDAAYISTAASCPSSTSAHAPTTATSSTTAGASSSADAAPAATAATAATAANASSSAAAEPSAPPTTSSNFVGTAGAFSYSAAARTPAPPAASPVTPAQHHHPRDVLKQIAEVSSSGLGGGAGWQPLATLATPMLGVAAVVAWPSHSTAVAGAAPHQPAQVVPASAPVSTPAVMSYAKAAR
ncbi:hypothetical protein FOA52_010826 [Chlamydomonas sp. UWO 241]|nr:hypothetical protein FOA52_010826 [Chlamydomonas sp. UWO 241]